MSAIIHKLIDRWTHYFWSDDVKHQGVQNIVIRVVRLIYVVMRHLYRGELTLRAMSLVYTTLLSLVPLLAVSFSVLKGFGVHNQIEPLLLKFLTPLGPKSVELTDRIIGFVANVKVGVLGSLALLFLLYTVVSLTQKIESSFNFVWRVERLRGLAQRFANYLSVILVGPVLMFVALGITATISSHSVVQYLSDIEPFGQLFILAGKVIPYLLVIGVFSFLYMLIPNTRVKLFPAIAGGIVAGVLWKTTGWGFATFISNSGNYAAIYSSFAILILLLIWLYLSWLILLVGSQFAFYVQYPQYVTRFPVELELSNRLRERLTLHIMALVADRHVNQGDPWTSEALISHLGLPAQPVYKVLSLLQKKGYLSETSDSDPAYLPRRDIDTILVSELLHVVRSSGENRFLSSVQLKHHSQVDDTLDKVQSAINSSLSGLTLRQLVNRSKEQAGSN